MTNSHHHNMMIDCDGSPQSQCVYLDEQQYVQDFGLSLAVLLSQHQHVQQAAPHLLTQLRQTSLQLRHRVHPALTVLHHLREQQGEGAHTHLGFRSAQRPLQYSRLASGEASLHSHSITAAEAQRERKETLEAINTTSR